MEAGHNSGRTVEQLILHDIANVVRTPLSTFMAGVNASVGIAVSETYVTGILEANGYRIKNEGGGLIVEKVAPEDPVG